MAPIYEDPGLLEFDGQIQEASGGGAFIDFPFDIFEQFGVYGRVPVKADFEGIPYQGSLVKMHPGAHILIIKKEIREKLNKVPGDTVHVTVQLDKTTRVVEVADDVKTALTAHPKALEVYESMPYSHQKEYIMWVEDAKKPETRVKRIEKMIKALVEKK